MNSIDPKNETTKFCIYCGKKIPINAKKCSYCFEWLDDEFSVEDSNSVGARIAESSENKKNPNSYLESQNENTNKKTYNFSKESTEYSKIIPMRRFYLLMILTFGLYRIYWFYKNSSYLRDEFGKDISVGLRTLTFAIIPIANIIVFYELLNDMKKLIEDKGLEVYSPGLNTLILLFIPFFELWVYINVQESFNDFWRIQEPHLQVRREFNNGEILVIILMIIVVIIIILLYISLLIFLQSYPYY